jgi:hypothetical protein
MAMYGQGCGAWVGAFLLFVSVPSVHRADGNLNDLPSDLVVPETTDEAPAPGRRVRLTLPDYAGYKLSHVLYLPPEWKRGAKYGVIVEFPGNGNYRNNLGDRSTGLVEDCKLGYGISGGKGFLWLCLPFVDTKNKSHTIQWWGDPDATAAYCRKAVAQICHEYGGDAKAIVLTGFSRGAIACGYIGLHDDETAQLWRAIVAHSHFDGVRRWGYSGDDAASAQERWKRWKGRPLFASHEKTVAEIERFAKSCDLQATLMPLPFPNHSPEWVLKDIPERTKLREWLKEALKR